MAFSYPGYDPEEDFDDDIPFDDDGESEYGDPDEDFREALTAEERNPSLRSQRFY